MVPLPVSVPGCVDGWFELHERFGSLEMQNYWNQLLAMQKMASL